VVVVVWYCDLQLPIQSVPITINILSSNPAQARCTERHSIADILLKMALNIKIQTQILIYLLFWC